MKLLHEALKLAATGNRKKNHLLAAIAIRQDGTIVSSRNGMTQVPRPSAHAEARVLKKAGHGSVLYVAKISKKGEPGLAKPCANCMSLIKNKKVKRVYYTIGPDEFGVIDL